MAVLGRWTGGVIGTMQPSTSWAAPNGLFPTQDRNDSSTYTFTSSTSTVTIPASGLPDGYILKARFEFEDSSNGRHNPMGKFVQASGTSDGFVSMEVSGFNRDTSEDRSFVNVSAVVAGPSASSTFQFQWRRDSDAPNATDGVVSSTFEIIPIWFSNIGMYNSTATTAYTGATPNQVTLAAVYESDTAAIQIASNEATIKTDNKRYLILGGYRQAGGGTRTQKVTAITYDGTVDDATRGYSYIRSSANEYGGSLSWDIKERVTTDIDVGYAVWTGDVIGSTADLGGAENIGSTSLSSAHAGLVIIELNDDAEVFRSHDATGLQTDSTGTPTDLNAVRTMDINDATSFTRVSDTVVNAEQAMDAFVVGNVFTARASTSTARRTTRTHITVNGTEQDSTMDGSYSRGDQSTSGTFGGGSNPAGFLALASGDDIGMSQTAITGSEGGNPRTFAGGVGLMGINLDTLEAGAPGGDVEVTATTATIDVTPTNAVVTYTATPDVIMSAGLGTDGASTSRLTGMTGTFTAGEFNEVSGTSGDVDIVSDGHSEFVYSVEFTHVATDASDYQFRLVLDDGTVLDTYTQTPTVTVGSGGDVTVTATTATIDVNATNATVVVETDTILTATTGTITVQPTNAVVVTEIDTVITSTGGTVDVNKTNATVVIETDVNVTATSGTITVQPTNATVVALQDTIVTATTATVDVNSTNAIVVVETDTVITSTSGTVDVNSTNATVLVETDTIVTATSATIDVQPTNATVVAQQDINVTATTATIDVNSTNATVVVETDTVITSTSGTVDVNSTNATVVVETDTVVTATTATVDVQPTNAIVVVQQDYILTATTGSVTVQGTNPNVAVGADINLTATTGSVTVQGTKASVVVEVDTNVTATTGSIDVNKTNAVVVYAGDIAVTATTATVTVQPTNAVVVVETDTVLTATTATVDVNTTNAVVVYDRPTEIIATSGSITVQSTNAIVFVGVDLHVVATTATVDVASTDTTVVIETDVTVVANTATIDIDSTNTTVAYDLEWRVEAGTASVEITPKDVTVITPDEELLARDSRLYFNFITQFNASGIDLVNDTIKVVPMSEDYVYNYHHVYYSEVNSYAVSPTVELTGNKWISNSNIFRYDVSKLKFISTSGVVGGFLLYKDTGDDTTSELISFHKEDFSGVNKGLSSELLEWVPNTGGFFEVEPENVYVGRTVSYADLKTARRV